MTLYEREAGDLAGIRACADAHGFCLVRNVFNDTEVASIRAGMKTVHEGFSGDMPDLLSCPPLRHILLDARILSIARVLLGDDLVYYPETAVNYEETVGPITLQPYSVLHCDAVGGPHDLRTRWRSPTNALYRGYRFGLYLQDYEGHSGGLKLGIGSHRGDPDVLNKKSAEETGNETLDVDGRRLHMPTIDFPLYNVPSHPGDVVIWNLRTFHSAGARLLRTDPTRALHPDVERYVHEHAPEALLPIPGPRLTIFFDLAAPTEDVDLYIKARTERFDAAMFRRFMYSRHDKENIVAEARRHGVRVRFDYLLAALTIILVKQMTSDHPAVIARILAMADQHEEFSPYFPLFDRARYLAARNNDDERALQIVLEGVTHHLEVLRGDAQKAS